MRSWVVWLSFILLAATIGWFWLLSHDLRFVRAELDGKTPPVETKSDAPKKGG